MHLPAHGCSSEKSQILSYDCLLFPCKLAGEHNDEFLARLMHLVDVVREPGTDDWAQRSELPVVHCSICLALPWPGLGAKGVVQSSTSSALQ